MIKGKNDARELILVDENVIVSWLAGTEQARVAVEIEIVFDWTHDVRVDDRARDAIPVLATVPSGSGEEYDLVLLSNHDQCDRGVEIQLCTCACGIGWRLL